MKRERFGSPNELGDIGRLCGSVAVKDDSWVRAYQSGTVLLLRVLLSDLPHDAVQQARPGMCSCPSVVEAEGLKSRIGGVPDGQGPVTHRRSRMVECRTRKKASIKRSQLSEDLKVQASSLKRDSGGCDGIVDDEVVDRNEE